MNSHETPHLTNLIGGRLSPPHGESYLEVHEPATGELVAYAPDSDATDIESAVEAARDAASVWAATPAYERARMLMRLSDLVEDEIDALAEAESRDTGKPLRLARTVDIPRAIANLRFFAGAATQFASESHGMED